MRPNGTISKGVPGARCKGSAPQPHSGLAIFPANCSRCPIAMGDGGLLSPDLTGNRTSSVNPGDEITSSLGGSGAHCFQ
jgi:hypothetical protein